MGSGALSADQPNGKTKGRGLSVNHDLVLVFLDEKLLQALAAHHADVLLQVVSVPVVEQAEVVTPVGSGNTLVTARDHVRAVDVARIQDVEYKRGVVDGSDLEVHGRGGNCCTEVRQATPHGPGTRRQTCATVSCRSSLDQRCCTARKRTRIAALAKCCCEGS